MTDSIEVAQEMIDNGDSAFCQLVHGAAQNMDTQYRRSVLEALYRAMHAARPDDTSLGVDRGTLLWLESLGAIKILNPFSDQPQSSQSGGRD